MTVTVFTAGHESPRGTFYPYGGAPEVAMGARDAAALLRLFGIIDRYVVSDPGHAVVDPVQLAEWLAGPAPVTFRSEIDALLRLCDFAHELRMDVAWGF